MYYNHSEFAISNFMVLSLDSFFDFIAENQLEALFVAKDFLFELDEEDDDFDADEFVEIWSVIVISPGNWNHWSLTSSRVISIFKMRHITLTGAKAKGTNGKR